MSNSKKSTTNTTEQTIQNAPATETPAAESATTVQATEAAASVVPAASPEANVEITLVGELTDKYVGPAKNKSLVQMFPKLADGKKYQIRMNGNIRSQSKNWTYGSAELKVVAHATHG